MGHAPIATRITAAACGIAAAATWAFANPDLSGKYLGPVSIFAGFAASALFIIGLRGKPEFLPFAIAGFALTVTGLVISLVRQTGFAPPVAAVTRAPLAVNYGMVHITRPVDGGFSPTCTTVTGTAIPPGAGKLWLVVGGAVVRELTTGDDGGWRVPVRVGADDPRDADREYDIRVYWVPAGSRPPAIPAQGRVLDEITVVKDPARLACVSPEPTNADTPG
ncbi:hypothetical protein GT755_20175 [Herbidospora sp. NEAU-GS84]|uniref:DUF4131 domain-containing protein n=1 Tax=Herbidospora solisilvae TaxID=2696284 RepID=A0A7C9NPQ5_9ACTN|nr:hypothetical protein [Herbidospora solisilvae]NAS23996.1 hypothetical protein [Herbidospora solisilvae]